MALKLEGRDDNLKKTDFLNFGRRFGVTEAATKTILSELLEESEPWVKRLGEIGLEPKKEADLKAVIKKRKADLS